MAANGPEVRKSVGTAPADFLTVGWKPLDFQRLTVGRPFPLGLRGRRGRKEGGVFKGLLLLLRTFFSICTPERKSGEPVFS